MGNCWTIRPAKASDATVIVSIIRSAFPSQLLELFVYGCPGIERFVAEQIMVQDKGGDTAYTVATADGKVIACAVVRRLHNRLYLNYIAVLASQRSQGLGKQLLYKALLKNNHNNVDEIVLDVFEFNTDVFHWYKRLGFQDRETITWRQCSSDGSQPEPIILMGYAQAQASQREFGFSKFTIQAGEHRYEVGQLGEHWYRLTDLDALTAPGLAAGLRCIAPHRRILMLAEPDAMNISLPNSREITRTHRLVAARNDFKHRLKQV